MRTLEHVTAGEEVVLNDVNRPARKVKVERVGRTNIYVSGVEIAFDRKTGNAKDRYRNRHIKTVDEWDRQQQASAALAEMYRFGVEVRHYLGHDVILAIHTALKPLMDAAKPKD